MTILNTEYRTHFDLTVDAPPKLSVSIVTYDQEAFIGQALDSVLMQRTDFDFEIVIGEDCSTDRTREIVEQYARLYPDRIRALLHPYNLGPSHIRGKNNFVATFEACRGKYVALLEGDDYWTDLCKLQKQVDFLDNHPDFSTCFHWADWLDEESCRIKPGWRLGPPLIKPYYTLDDLLEHGNFIQTASVMFRNNLFGHLPD